MQAREATEQAHRVVERHQEQRTAADADAEQAEACLLYTSDAADE